MTRRRPSKTPIWSSSTPAISARRRRKRSFPNSASCANQAGARAAGRDTKIAVAGCVAQAEGAEILRRQKSVDLVVGPQSYHRLPDLLRARARGSVVDTDFPIEDKFDHLPRPKPEKTKARGVSAFLTVQEGCDKFCTFCVVPYTRGAEVSRPAGKILAEAEELAAAACARLTLIGQNVNAYHGRRRDRRVTGRWPDWRARLAEIPGLARMRYTTSHPGDMGDDLIAAHRADAGFDAYLHLPVQSGSTGARGDEPQAHRRRLPRPHPTHSRRAPDIALSSDFIVGFPGESEADFEDTLRLIARSALPRPSRSNIRARPGTPAAQRPDQVARR
jgi:tRNA-2-methylthio-N6-dimethylallyladenosine synthase